MQNRKTPFLNWKWPYISCVSNRMDSVDTESNVGDTPFAAAAESGIHLHTYIHTVMDIYKFITVDLFF